MHRAKWSILIAVSFLGVSLAGCLPGNVVRIDTTYDGKTVTVPLDGKLYIVLDSNATTGYAWALDSVDESILENKGSTYIAPASNLVGAGGQESWEFAAVGTGQTTLKLKYIRSWEPEVEPADTFEVTVTVE